MKKQIGIYKITSPSNKIYIGQTVNFYKRIDFYKNCRCKTQKKLYNSIKKYDWSNHKLELIEECSIELLNERERYWQDYYDVLNTGLNCRLTQTTDKSGILSNETKEKISRAMKNNPNNINKTVKLSSRLKQSNTKCIFEEEERFNIWNMILKDSSFEEIKVKYPIYYKNQHAAICKGRIWNLITGLSKPNISKNYTKGKKVICTETNVIYGNAKEAYLTLYVNRFSYNYFKCMLAGHNKNITTLKYL